MIAEKRKLFFFFSFFQQHSEPAGRKPLWSLCAISACSQNWSVAHAVSMGHLPCCASAVVPSKGSLNQWKPDQDMQVPDQDWTQNPSHAATTC